MTKSLLIITTCLFTAWTYSQQLGSPYSYYGVGELNVSSTVASGMMGRLSVYSDSLQINLINPASYGELKLINFTGGGTYSKVNLATPNSDQSYGRVDIEYLTLAVPISPKTAFGFGLMPYSTVSYRLSSEEVLSDIDALKTNSGIGGINRVFISLGHTFGKHLSIGGTIHYNFGSIETQQLVTKKDVQYLSRQTNISNLNGIGLDLGIKYKGSLTDKYNLSLSATYSPQTTITSINGRSIALIDLYSSSLSQRTVDFLEVDLTKFNLDKTTIKLPATTTIGAGIGEKYKWFVGVEYRLDQWSGFANDFQQANDVRYQDASIYTIGGYFIPKYDAYDQFLKKIVYRAGFSFGDSGMLINNHEIDIFGISGGVGLPIGRFNKLNLGFEYRQRGKKEIGLVEEYFNLKIGFSFNDLWFIKRKYN